MERKQLELFFKSPFYNNKAEFTQCLSEISTSIDNKALKNLNKATLWKAVFPKKSFNDLKFRRLLSDMYKLSEEFLMVYHFRQHAIKGQSALLNEYNERSQDKLIPQVITNTRKSLDKYPYRDSLFYQEKYYAEVEINRHLQYANQRSNVNNLEQATRALDVFFLINKLKLYCEYTNYQKVINLNYDIFLMDEILEHLKNVNYPDIPAIDIYYHILLTLTDGEDPKHFNELKKLLSKHTNKFQLSEQRIMYGYAQNYCIRMVNSGQLDFLKALFELFKAVLNKKVLLDKGFISPWDYKNITAYRITTKRI